MAINRYKLRHLVSKKHNGALRVSQLLKRPDRLIGVILLGNNFVNILASSIATVIAIELMGQAGIALAALLLTVVILIISEVAPKTIAARNPEKIAFPVSYIIQPLLKILYPLVWLVNYIANNLLKLLGFSESDATDNQSLNSEELRTVVNEAKGMIPPRHQQMLLSILDLEKVTVEDVMIPSHEIIGIDLDDPLDIIMEEIVNAQHTRLPLYKGDINNVIGVLHLRKLLGLMNNPEFSKKILEKTAMPAYFIPTGTALNKQLLNFQQYKGRIGLVVNEYGDIQGLVTLEHILEEIVGEFTKNSDALNLEIDPQTDGSVFIDGSSTIRELNRKMNWQLPTKGPKTINGLILEYLEDIPEAGTSLRLGSYIIEIVQLSNNAVTRVHIYKRT